MNNHDTSSLLAVFLSELYLYKTIFSSDNDDFLSEIIQVTEEQLSTDEGTLNDRVNLAKYEINVNFKINKISDSQTKEVRNALNLKN